MRLSRSTALKIAAILSFLLGLVATSAVLPELARGAAELDNDAGFPFVVVVFVLGILRLVGAYGVWMRQRWGIVLTILANLIDAFLAAPGLLFAPTTEMRVDAFMGVVGGIIIIALCLWRDPSRATT